MRLIDADELLKQYTRSHDIIYTLDIMNRIKNAPTVDAVEVVRCKDCANSTIEGIDKGYCWCDANCGVFKLNEFCSKGKRWTKKGKKNE